MNQKLGIGILSTTAVILLGLNLTAPGTSEAGVIAVSRDFQAATTRSQTAGENLYILDNRTGQIAVFAYDTRDRAVRPRDVRFVRDLFSGR